MDLTCIPTAELCSAVAAELRNRGVAFALVAMVDDSIHAHMPSHVPGEVDRQARRLFSTIRDIVGGDEWEETRIARGDG